MVLPLIFGLLGSGLASSGALAGLGALASPLVAGSVGAGLGATAQTGDLEQGMLTGLGALAGGALLGPVIGGMGGKAAAAGTTAAAQGATQAATQAATQGIANPALAQAATQGATNTAGAALANANPALGGTTTSILPQLQTAATKLGVTPTVGPLAQRGLDAARAASAVSAGPQGGIGGMLGSGRVGDIARGGLAYGRTPTGIGMGIGSTVGGLAARQMAESGRGRGRDKDVNNEEVVPIPRPINAPPADYRPGIDPEWNYGLGNAQTAAQILDYNRRFYGGGVVKALGPIKLAKGGIASLGGMDAQEHNTDAPSGGNEKDVVVEAIRAIKGQVEDPRPALGRFLAMYGEDALRDLVDKVQSGKAEGEASKDGGRVQGPGDGMDDRVPAKIKESGEDVLLADSEYVVPADVVSHLGNGSSEAGAKQLDAMLDRVRESRTGKKEQAPAINAKKALPA